MAVATVVCRCKYTSKDYAANAISDTDTLRSAGYPMQATDTLRNLLVVPDKIECEHASQLRKRRSSSRLVQRLEVATVNCPIVSVEP